MSDGLVSGIGRSANKVSVVINMWFYYKTQRPALCMRYLDLVSAHADPDRGLTSLENAPQFGSHFWWGDYSIT